MQEQLQAPKAGRRTPIKDEAPGVWCAKGLGEGLSEGFHGTASQVVPQGAATAFTFDRSAVRAIVKDGEVWFVATDVCAVLGYDHTPSAMRRLDDDEKGVHSTHTPGGMQELTIISESGLFSLILGSRKPEARRFKKWVTSEVLPAIRRTGAYAAPAASAAPALPRTYKEALLALVAAEEEKESQRLQLEQQRPAVEFVDRYVESTGTMGVRQVAKTLRANERELVAWLLERGVMYRLAGRLTPTAAHLDAGRFVVKTGSADNGHAYTDARFTPKGVEWVAGEWGKRLAGTASLSKKGRA
ncbi:BRO family protein [uncultured Azohydromonas sp.]|jgi:Prophage antirepressor|uniref:BRO family protein n=1 Tax=uncultured Azohydromonas sp. TaxID=487342 RepID=UPI00260A702F|nr:BRO family protein [uncultured Azohydromonas sp.]